MRPNFCRLTDWKPIVLTAALSLSQGAPALAKTCAPYADTIPEMADQLNERPMLEYDLDGFPGFRVVLFVSPDLSTLSVLTVHEEDGTEIVCTTGGPTSGTNLRSATAPGKGS